jgi:hypothetical protein
MLRKFMLFTTLVLFGALLFASVAYAAHTDHLSHFHSKLTVTATYQPKSNRTVCDLRDRRIKGHPNFSYPRWHMPGKYSAENCLRAWVQQ